MKAKDYIKEWAELDSLDRSRRKLVIEFAETFSHFRIFGVKEPTDQDILLARQSINKSSKPKTIASEVFNRGDDIEALHDWVDISMIKRLETDWPNRKTLLTQKVTVRLTFEQ